MDYANHLWRHRAVQLHAYITPPTSFLRHYLWEGFESVEDSEWIFHSAIFFWSCFPFSLLCHEKITFFPISSSVSNVAVAPMPLYLIHMEIYPVYNRTKGMLDFRPGMNGNGFAIWFLWSSKLQLSITGNGTIYWLGFLSHSVFKSLLEKFYLWAIVFHIHNPLDL